MPPGNVISKPPVKVIEKTTAEACLAIARRIQQAHRLSGDDSGSEAVRQVAESIRRELLRS
jgi:hypothetical protein